MIHVTWPPGCYGHYVMQSIFAYSNLGNGYKVKIEADGSSHGFAARSYFTYDHLCVDTSDLIIAPDKSHNLDYLNNQLIKQDKGDIIKSISLSFPNFKDALKVWKDSNSNWALREWVSFWLYDNMKEAYATIKGHITTTDLFNKNVFPKLINHLGLTIVVDDATMKHNQSNWIAKQRYHNSQHRCNRWVQDILEGIDTKSPCQTILDEAYVQHCLRKQGYEIYCDGLNKFPTNSQELRELIYENCNTDNKR